MSVKFNTIDLYGGGVDARPTSMIEVIPSFAWNFRIEQNRIRSLGNTGSSRWGMFVHGAEITSQGNTASDNDVFGHNLFDDGCCAFHFVGSGDFTICNNFTDNTYRGFHFSATCGPSFFGQNSINDHDFANAPFIGTGLLIEDFGDINGLLGDQICSGNQWNDNPYPSGAWNAQFIGNGIDGSEFFVQNINDPQQAPTDRNPWSGWFFPSMDNCQTSNDSCGSLFAEPPRVDDWDKNTALEWQSGSLPNNGLNWSEIYRLMKKLTFYPHLADTNVLMGQFRTHYQNSSAGKYASFDLALHNALLAAPAHQTALNNLMLLEANIMFRLDSLDAAQQSPPDPKTNSTYFELRRKLAEELSAVSTARQGHILEILNKRKIHYGTLGTQLQALPKDKIWESNQAFLVGLVMNLAIRQAEMDTTFNGATPGGYAGFAALLSAAELQALHQIAQQCQQTAGRTRDLAIALLPVEEARQYQREQPYLPVCPNEPLQSLTAETELTLSPNPSSDAILLQFGQVFSGDLFITDALGRIIVQLPRVREQSSLLVNIGNLANGTYFLLAHSQTPAQPVQRRKFIVVR
jgi:hypothetical protein